MSNSYLIRNATIVNQGHSNHLEKRDIHVLNGKIQSIDSNINFKGTEIVGDDLFVSIGWTDLKVHLSDPGFEYKDSLESILETAAASGYTGVCTLPNTQPRVTNKSIVKYLLKNAEGKLTSLFPLGMISEDNSSENMAELFDMHSAGAIGFTNGDTTLKNGLLKKALLYCKPFNGKVISQPLDTSLHQGGVVNESDTTIHTGLKASPSIAEFLAVQQQIEIAKYCNAGLHISGISCKESVESIKQAKADGVEITCDASIFNLCFTDKEILNFDENFKVFPLLRTEEDRLALVKGVNSGVIDAISSNHYPQNIESKRVEFDYADFGALSLPFMYSWYLDFLSKDIKIETFISKISKDACNVLGLELAKIKEGEQANLTVFDAGKKWVFNKDSNESLSVNSHEFNKELTGCVIATFNNNKIKIKQ